MNREVANYDVIAELARCGVPARAILLGDSAFALPTEQWITGPFAVWFSKVLSKLGITYKAEIMDCDDFARLCAWGASYCHSLTAKAPESGIAFGELWIANKQHAVNFAVHQLGESSTLYIVAYEPQIGKNGFSCQRFPMTEKDFQSVIMARL